MSVNQENTGNSQTVAFRALLAILLPLIAAISAGILISNFVNVEGLSSQARSAVLLSSIAVVSWILGLRWYGIPGLGLRGGRPLYAGIGFAVLGWIIFLLARFFFVDILTLGPPNSFRSYFYLLLFESFATQIWTFGLIFRAFSEWRGPLTGAIVSGIFFSLAAIVLFQESFVATQVSILFFVTWGLLYGLIRLRTGSLIGTVIVQSLQSFSIWIALSPSPTPDAAQLQSMYVATAIGYALVIWRLWPNQEEDYRV